MSLPGEEVTHAVRVTSQVVSMDLHKSAAALSSFALAATLLAGGLAEHAVSPSDPLFPTRTGARLSHDAIERRLAGHLGVARTICPTLASVTYSAMTCTASPADRATRAKASALFVPRSPIVQACRLRFPASKASPSTRTRSGCGSGGLASYRMSGPASWLPMPPQPMRTTRLVIAGASRLSRR